MAMQCTASTAHDAITGFRKVQTPTVLAESVGVFSGPVAHSGYPSERNHHYFGSADVLFSPTLSAVFSCHPKQLLRIAVNDAFQCKA